MYNIVFPKILNENEIKFSDLNEDYLIIAHSPDMCMALIRGNKVLKKDKKTGKALKSKKVWGWLTPQGKNLIDKMTFDSIQEAVEKCHLRFPNLNYIAYYNRE